jgi:hypothetical protein
MSDGDRRSLVKFSQNKAHLTPRRAKAWTYCHGDEESSIREIDYSSGRIQIPSHLWNGGQHRRYRERREESQQSDNSDHDPLLVFRELTIVVIFRIADVVNLGRHNSLLRCELHTNAAIRTP